MHAIRQLSCATYNDTPCRWLPPSDSGMGVCTHTASCVLTFPCSTTMCYRCVVQGNSPCEAPGLVGKGLIFPPIKWKVNRL